MGHRAVESISFFLKACPPTPTSFPLVLLVKPGGQKRGGGKYHMCSSIIHFYYYFDAKFSSPAGIYMLPAPSSWHSNWVTQYSWRKGARIPKGFRFFGSRIETAFSKKWNTVNGMKY
ncbi:hypothetical protein CEXT_232701 [Caerostris extrusa]|uniref:Uncharacterized protein n=1 Tax=Caerostris extrusa TaxID=172846 RepID=A0AAV4XAJ4_CAEEX|nr:hypothetical protein CEXT_232701 [Caerostris extrusa]